MSSKSQSEWQPPFNTDYKLTVNDESFKQLMNMDAVSHAMLDLHRGQRILVKLNSKPSQIRLVTEILEQQLIEAAIDVCKVQQYFINIEPSGKDNDEYHIRAKINIKTVSSCTYVVRLYRTISIELCENFLSDVILVGGTILYNEGFFTSND